MRKSDSGRGVAFGDRVEQLTAILKSRYRLDRKKVPPFRALISALLSHRTKDEVTERVASHLFSKYKTPEDFAKLAEEEIASLINGVGFYRVKAKRIKEISHILIERWNSEVPSSFDVLLSLPGVGRKTANCVLAYGFGIPALPVDTHVHRISNRLGLVTTRTPEETEKALMRLVLKDYWGWLNTALVEFGKETCKPIKPLCGKCELNSMCLHHSNLVLGK